MYILQTVTFLVNRLMGLQYVFFMLLTKFKGHYHYFQTED